MTPPSGNYRHTKISYEQFRDLMLIEIADRYHDHLDEFAHRYESEGAVPILSIKKIADFEEYIYQPEWIKKVIDELAFENCVTPEGKSTDDDDGYGVYLDPAGWERAERLIQEYYGVSGEQEFVEIDHSSPTYKVAVDSISKLIAEVRGSNSYAGTDIQDRDRRISELEAGRKLLESRRVSRTAISATLISALAWLIDKFAGTPIEELSRAAWRAIFALFGQHLG